MGVLEETSQRDEFVPSAHRMFWNTVPKLIFWDAILKKEVAKGRCGVLPSQQNFTDSERTAAQIHYISTTYEVAGRARQNERK